MSHHRAQRISSNNDSDERARREAELADALGPAHPSGISLTAATL